jgi:hypothetical protein
MNHSRENLKSHFLGIVCGVIPHVFQHICRSIVYFIRRKNIMLLDFFSESV